MSNNAAHGSYPYKGIIHAPRIKGNLDPGLEYSRIQGDSTAAWAASDFPGGLLPGGSYQSVYAVDATQNYRIGTRRIEYGRTFRYSLAGADLKAIGCYSRLLINGNLVPATGAPFAGGWEGTPGLHADAAIGSLYVDVADTYVRAINFYQGGILVVFASDLFHQYFIVASRAAAADDDYVRCYLDHPTENEILLIGDGVGVYRSPYSNVTERVVAENGYQSFVGLVHSIVEDENWFWLQTGGPCWVTPNQNEEPGDTANFRDVYAHVDGTIGSGNLLAFGHQRVGYVLGGTWLDDAHGDGMIMLQLDTT